MRIYIVTLAFCRAKLLNDALHRFKAETDLTGINYHHLVLNCRYPMGLGNDEDIHSVCKEHNTELLVIPSNLGISGNYTAAFNHIAPDDNTLMVFYDPDSRPRKLCWLKALIKVFAATNCAFISLSRTTPDLMQPPPNVSIDGVKCRQIKYACGWPMGAYGGSFVKLVDNFTSVDDNGVVHNYYGFGENESLRLMNKHNKVAYMMLDQVDWGFEDPSIQSQFDIEYVQWKIQSAHKQTNKDFKDWLVEKGLCS
jgi:hypothetical protein